MPDVIETRFLEEIEALGHAGKEELAWLRDQCDFTEVLPLALELCRLADRLAEVRGKIRQQGLTINGKRNPLLSAEVALGKNYMAAWKALGLADKNEDGKRRVGRPNGSGQLW